MKAVIYENETAKFGNVPLLYCMWTNVSSRKYRKFPFFPACAENSFLEIKKEGHCPSLTICSYSLPKTFAIKSLVFPLSEKIKVELQLTDPDITASDRVVKSTERTGLYNAMDIGSRVNCMLSGSENKEE